MHVHYTRCIVEASGYIFAEKELSSGGVCSAGRRRFAGGLSIAN